MQVAPAPIGKEDAKVAKKYWVLPVLCIAGMALVASASYKPYIGVHVNMFGVGKAQYLGSQEGYEVGAASRNQANAIMPANHVIKFKETEWVTRESMELTRCASFSDLACPLGYCSLIGSNGVRCESNDSGCQCGLEDKNMFDFKLKISLEFDLGQAELCVRTKCTGKNCKGNGLDAASVAAGKSSSGGALNALPIALDKLSDIGCFSISVIGEAGGNKFPEWVEPVIKTAVILPALLLAAMMLWYIRLALKKTTAEYSSNKCCLLVMQLGFLIAVVLALILGAVFLFLLPRVLEEQVFKGIDTHMMTPTPLGIFGLSELEFLAGEGARQHFVGGVIALVVWVLSWNCCKCCRW